jgi:ComEC/Rec2-related protein
MTPWGLLIICWAYLLGLLATGITEARILSGVSVIGCGMLLIGIVSSLVVPHYWQEGPTARQWWIAGLVALVAASYCIGRSPQAAPNDISRFVSRQEQVVFGQVMQMPQNTRQGKASFFLQVRSVRKTTDKKSFEASRSVSGKLYVTAALAPSKRLYPGEMVELKGEIYGLRNARETDKSSFGDYLAKQGCFAGFKTHWIEFLPNQTPPRWAMWRLRQRIVLAQGRWLGEPAGNLLSAMTLGRGAVDLPYDVKDSFVQAGLAHTLASSGFQVSLILGMVLGALRSQSPQIQAGTGLLSLAIYVGLTGVQASVIRAAVMGVGALIGIALQRKVKPLGCLLMAVNTILLVNPQWIWDVGFQLSAVATLGLIVTVPQLMLRLDWLPVNIATLFAVPIAAYLWAIPLQLLYFEVLPTYSVLLNAIVTPMVVVLSLGGFVSAIAAVVVPVVGSAIAANLYYPIHLLIALANWFNRLPGHSIEITGIHAWHVAASYSVYAVICIWLFRQQEGVEIELLA